MNPQPKSRPARNKAYIRFIAAHPCAICGGQSVAHHENEPGHGTMAGKCCDSRCLPLCPKHYHYRHNGNSGRAIWHTWGVDPEAVITRMQAEWLDKKGKKFW